ncbi:hypothetical protein [Actinosynnema sp. NPDC020468]|uniref:hypothetical protein n=1 Tax=Actinosynnema sp. NPDC020468 TaxID=3154488 RepID=UPI0033F20181
MVARAPGDGGLREKRSARTPPAQDEVTTAADDLYPQVVAAVVGAGLGTAMAHRTRDPARDLVALLPEPR